jgi:hypothetical protein
MVEERLKAYLQQWLADNTPLRSILRIARPFCAQSTQMLWQRISKESVSAKKNIGAGRPSSGNGGTVTPYEWEKKVQGEFVLIYLCYNFKRMLIILGSKG